MAYGNRTHVDTERAHVRQWPSVPKKTCISCGFQACYEKRAGGVNLGATESEIDWVLYNRQLFNHYFCNCSMFQLQRATHSPSENKTQRRWQQKLGQQMSRPRKYLQRRYSILQWVQLSLAKQQHNHATLPHGKSMQQLPNKVRSKNT